MTAICPTEYDSASERDELKTVKRCAKHMFWCCIGLFAIVLSLAITCLQQIRNAELLAQENTNLRIRLNSESSRRHTLEALVEGRP